MNTVIAEFCHRVERIPFHGLGLSADAYQPDFFDLMTCLQQAHCEPDFVELFRATSPMVAAIRRRYPELPMPYHAEGLWLTQPDWLERPDLPEDLVLAVEQVRTLGSAWLNHECASKVVGGYPFGTYLPPRFTTESARVVAGHACRVQHHLDECVGRGMEEGPLLLLELPPLTYFGIGEISVAEFFRLLAEWTPCGLVLDVGHLWTHYRYGPRLAGDTLDRFVARFLDEFPLDRVVEIHVAGLAPHPSGPPVEQDGMPFWVDTHGARIPDVLVEMLDQMIRHPRLVSVKGVALEIDTKSVELIAEEFGAFRRRFETTLERRYRRCAQEQQATPAATRSLSRQDSLAVEACKLAERAYAELLLGRQFAGEGLRQGNARHMARYRETYLPYELLHWGGDVEEMFPQTCAVLAQEGVALDAFVSFWFARPRVIPAPFDFFLLKIQWFVEFVRERSPASQTMALREAEILQDAYDYANDPLPTAQEGHP